MCRTYFLREIPKHIRPGNIGSRYKELLKEVRRRKSKMHGDGCCNGVSTEWVKKVHGYDERYIGYGAEDSDFALRASLAGLKRKWVNKYTTMIHLPHPKVGEYYNQAVFKRNREMFFHRRKKKKGTIVNKGGEWGKV
jgi:GT2 family glycosyltransferase